MKTFVGLTCTCDGYYTFSTLQGVMCSLEIFTTEVVAFFSAFLFISAGFNKLVRPTVMSLLFNQEDKQYHDCSGSKQASAKYSAGRIQFTSFLIKTCSGGAESHTGFSEL